MPKKDNIKTLQTIGRTERADIPEWELFDLEAKIDTGAYTSSLHCHHIEQKEKDGRTMVCFNLLDPTQKFTTKSFLSGRSTNQKK